MAVSWHYDAATAHKASAESIPKSGSCIVEAAPVPGVIEEIEDALGPDGTAVASGEVPEAPVGAT
jgi:hypothetical protein